MLPFQGGDALSGSDGRYAIVGIQSLARKGRVFTTKRVIQWLSNHDYDVKGTVTDVLLSLESHGTYIGSCTLVNGETADEYIVRLPDDDWYLKFWLDKEQLIVEVWSCCWDGVVH
jgi:hypothetical protein